MAATGQLSAASSSQVIFLTSAFLARDLPSNISKDAGHIETHAPQPMHLLASTDIFAINIYACLGL